MVQLQTDANSEARTCELTYEAVTLEKYTRKQKAGSATRATPSKSQRTLPDNTAQDG